MKYSFLGKDKKEIIRLFSVKEFNNSIDSKYLDLLLTFPGKGLFKYGISINDLIRNDFEDEFSKQEGPHISIHYEPEKPTIFINKTAGIRQGSNINGVKNGNLFAPVLIKIFGQTGHSYFKAKQRHLNKGESTKISFNSEKDTLVMFFLISKKGVVFAKDLEYPAKYFEKEFNDFRLTVIFRYFNKPPEKVSVNFFPSTNPGEIITGLKWWQAYNLLNDLEMQYVEAYFKEHPERN